MAEPKRERDDHEAVPEVEAGPAAHGEDEGEGPAYCNEPRP